MILTALTHPNKHHPSKLLPLSAMSITLLYSLAGYADPAAPDAGQTLRELQQQPVLNAPKADPQLHIDQELHIEEKSQGDNKTGNKIDDTRFMIKALHISGNSEISTAELQALVADLVGAEHNLTELNDAVARITAYYRERGYAVARAYLPAQEIKDGMVSINIIEGHIAKHSIDNRSRLSDKRVEDHLNRIKAGDVIKTAQIDRSLRLLNDTPGVGSVRATLQPGISVGTSDLVVELKPASLYSGNVSMDNYGDRYNGVYRLGGTINLNSPFKFGDQISLTALASNQNLASGRIAYQLPIGSDGLRVGVAYINTRYHLGKEFSNDGLHGTATSGSVFAVYPFIRSQNSNLTGIFTGEHKTLSDHIDKFATVTDKHVNVASLGLSGNHRDALGEGGISSLVLSLALGRLSIDSPDALATDDDSARSNGSYTRLSYTANRLQRLTDSDQLSLSLSGQQASKNLDSSEKFSLGGANGVRAYPQGEGVGDQGYLATLELRHDFFDTLQGTLFFDTGSVTINHEPFGPPASNSITLSGAGIGLNTDLAGTQFKVSLAWSTSGGQPTTIPASAVHTPTLWLQASEQF